MKEDIKRLPFGSELSPDVIDLPFLLEACKQYTGNKAAIEEAILNKYFRNSGGIESNKKKMAMNCRISLQNYKLIDKDCNLTATGELLYEYRNDECKMIKEFAKHILLNLNGLLFTQILKDMYISGEKVDLTSIHKVFLERKLDYPSGGKHPSIMRLWLSRAGVFTGGGNGTPTQIR